MASNIEAIPINVDPYFWVHFKGQRVKYIEIVIMEDKQNISPKVMKAYTAISHAKTEKK